MVEEPKPTGDRGRSPVPRGSMTGRERVEVSDEAFGVPVEGVPKPAPAFGVPPTATPGASPSFTAPATEFSPSPTSSVSDCATSLSALGERLWMTANVPIATRIPIAMILAMNDRLIVNFRRAIDSDSAPSERCEQKTPS